MAVEAEDTEVVDPQMLPPPPEDEEFQPEFVYNPIPAGLQVRGVEDGHPAEEDPDRPRQRGRGLALGGVPAPRLHRLQHLRAASPTVATPLDVPQYVVCSRGSFIGSQWVLFDW